MKKYTDLNEVKNYIRAQVDIVDLIARYTNLKKQGNRWIGLCVFHQDTNPSMTVSPFQKYHDGSLGCFGCFSCSISGDLFSFIERIHNVTFIESLEIIAEIYNLDLTEFQRELTLDEQERENGYNIVEQVADLFCQQLLNTNEKLQFFLERGITSETITYFKLGYSPSLQFAQTYCSGEVLQYIEPTLGNHTRVFGDRLLYPQWSISDKVFGFFARQPDTRAPEVPKYIGTSKEGKLYETTGRLFAFTKARKLLRNIDLPLILAEGFHDAVLGQQCGIPIAALSGTKISKEQIEVLQKHSIKKVIVCLDGDEGGREGMYEFARKCPEFPDVSCSFLVLEKEPEDEIRNIGSDNFITSLRNNTISPLDYIIWYKTRFTNINFEIPSAKLKLIEDMQPFLLAYPVKSMNRELGISSLSHITNLPKDSIEDYITEKSENSLINIQAEMIVLAEFALNQNAWITYAKISERDFSLLRFKTIFRLMREIYTEYAQVNIPLLITEAANKKTGEEVINTINKLQGIQRTNIEKFVQEIYEKGIRREAKEFLAKSQMRVKDTLAPINITLSEIIEDIVGTLEVKNEKRVCSSVVAIQGTLEEMERRQHIENGLPGLSLGPGWEWTDSMLGGLQGGRVYLIGAFQKTGKSVVATNWVHGLSISEHPGAAKAAGLLVSMEMTPQENNFRLIAIDSGIPEEFIKRSRFETQEQINYVIESIERIKKARITWMSQQNTVKEIAMQARILQSQGKLDYILIDYIQLLNLSPYKNKGNYGKHEEFGEASQDIKNLATSLDIPIIAAVQLNRDSQKEAMPSFEHIGSALKISQDAHAGLILAKRVDGMIGILDINRSGGTGTIRLAFDSNPQTSNLRVKELDILKKMGR